MRSLNLDQLRIFLAWSSAEVLCRGTACMVSNSNGALTKLWCDRFVACSNHGPIGQITQPSRCDDRCAFRLAGTCCMSWGLVVRDARPYRAPHRGQFHRGARMHA